MQSQAPYGRVFAELYEKKWTWFARQLAPRIEAFYASTPIGSRNRSILDVCCGTGQLALYFLERGFRVTGVDLSGHMLAHARGEAAEWIEAGEARFIQADATDFDVGGGYGLAVSTYDSLNHLPDIHALSACFRSVHRALAEGGWFLFDLNTELAFRRNWNGISVQDDEESMIVTRSIYDSANRRAFMKLSGFVRAEDGRYDRFEEFMSETAFPLRKVERALEDAGFGSVRYVDGADLGATLDNDPETKLRVFIVAGK
jgi:SAM-dependent methyltransferase